MNTLCALQKTAPPTNSRAEYEKLKNNLKRSTLAYGSAIASSYFITQGAEEGVSATLGVVSSFAYMNLLSIHVDSIERSGFQKQLLVPVGTCVFETMWNHAPFAFDFDYGATFAGFLAYKMALCAVLYDVVREMLLFTEKEH
jgi:hypothetical protein|tara:strand:- start:1460 stop:1885 length:426 start_codon:yes stop_codon:yes gene_type:complete